MPTITSLKYRPKKNDKENKQFSYQDAQARKAVAMLSNLKVTDNYTNIKNSTTCKIQKLVTKSVTPTTQVTSKIISHEVCAVASDDGNGEDSARKSAKRNVYSGKLLMECIRNASDRNIRMVKTKSETEPIPKIKEICMNTKKEHYKIEYKQSTLDALKFDPYKIYNFGEKYSGVHSIGRIPQDFYVLRRKLLLEGKLFEDPQFPCNDNSIYLDDGVSQFEKMSIRWKRPFEIADNPKFFVDGASRCDTKQGGIGNSWFRDAISNLTLNPTMFFHVVPMDQSFGEKYVGIFHFRFWQNGRWIDICIDDRLPTKNGQLIFIRSGQRNEFWGALLEKAHCKLHGSYEATAGGSFSESLVDLTGGICETILLNAETEPELFQMMTNGVQRNGMVGCYIMPESASGEADVPSGLVTGHAYSVTKIATIVDKFKKTVNLVRIRTPWGSATKWKGAWSDTSPYWNSIPEEELKKLNFKTQAKCEFWMEYSEFVENYTAAVICMINPQTTTSARINKAWDVNIYEGSWVNGVTAGGCRNFIDTFSMNPQYQIVIKPDLRNKDSKSTIIIGLIQKNRRRLKCMGQGDFNIGLALYKINDPEHTVRPLTKNFFQTNLMLTCEYVNMRELVARFKLEPGTYCIIPTTYEPHNECDFLLRVYSERRINMGENENAVNIMSSTELRDCMCEQYKKINLDTEKAMDDAVELFQKEAKGKEELNWIDIKKLVEKLFKQEGFPVPVFEKEIYKSFVSMFDSHHVGKMSQSDWLLLWNIMMKWATLFANYSGGSGQLEGENLRAAYKAGGITVNFHILNMLIHRFGEKEGYLKYESFLISAVKLECILVNFTVRREGSNELILDMRAFLESTLCI